MPDLTSKFKKRDADGYGCDCGDGACECSTAKGNSYDTPLQPGVEWSDDEKTGLPLAALTLDGAIAHLFAITVQEAATTEAPSCASAHSRTASTARLDKTAHRHNSADQPHRGAAQGRGRSGTAAPENSQHRGQRRREQ